MSYTNSYGATAGPIKIDKSWLSSIRQSNDIYFSVSADRESNHYRPILAGTPSYGYDPDTGKFDAPENAVITVGWFKATQSFDFSKLPELYPDQFALKDDLDKLKEELLSITTTYPGLQEAINKNTTSINNINDKIANINNGADIISNRLLKIHRWIVNNVSDNYNEDYPSKLLIQCGDADSFKSLNWGDS